MKYYLAIDIGASSGRHILAHLEDGRIVTEEIYRFSNGAKRSGENLKWDITRLFSEILNGLKEAKAIGKIPESVGVDTWGVDYVLLDECDREIDGAYCYRDARTEATIPTVHGIIPFERLYERTGISFNSFNTVYQLLCDKKSGRMAKAKSLLMLPDYFHFKLTGEKRQEHTNATTTGMVNAVTHEWDGEIIEALGYKKELFGALSEPGDTVGYFTDEIAEMVGYRAKVILPATHDTASAVLAAPLLDMTPYISSGTWSLLGVEEPFAHTDEAARESVYSNEGSIHNTFRFQKNIMGLWMIQEVRRELDGAYSFAELAEMARNNPIDDEINVNDHRFFAPKSMIGEIESAVGRKLSVGECAYCIFNNLARDYAESLKKLEEMTGKVYPTLNIIGGGSRNTFLNELTARYTGKRIITGPTEGTAIGNLLMQLIGDGAIPDIACGRQLVRQSFDINEVII
ncbi:MAG: rhamnulokinase [Clostridia bacterium]|nr:rhamnulokinase [Clostridia bacterium]